MDDLSQEELLRYSRHLVMPEVTLDGQRALKRARVLCVGTGGLGSPLALYLAAAGIGRLGLVEFDTVDASNIQRQVLYATGDIGRPKLEAARERLAGLNPHVDIVPHALRLSADNVMALLADYDIVVDGSDNFPTRYLVNDAAALAGKPLVHASVFRFEGQLSVFDARRGPCLRCLFPEPPPAALVPSCAEGGVMGMLPGIIGSMQALEVVKLVLGRGKPLIGRLLLFDGLGGEWRSLTVDKDPHCALCGPGASIDRPIAYTPDCAGAEAPAQVSAEEVAARLAADGSLQLVDVREPQEYAIAHIPGSVLIPLGELEGRLAELDPARPCILTCHRGGRSLRAHALLRLAGYRDLQVLAGGVEAWARRVDPSMPRY
ncbi:molybdopterin-synthase adenylyltransferase MoeB [Parahaliea mediterranea]|uniref:Molybdopterin-synthase adenylyltransferase n=1 Tax=Parahaliea mediterranea TaxID=651086 RepID=A0A939DIG5_9GAMM|nr:molybdopterin-synthase adenylyltransferase MoeB [Parahaliea mediterranea]MBN7798714.1 molybdopterin-synthase adenylyltransferase MoeB [Parahaliea mediterranea]